MLIVPRHRDTYKDLWGDAKRKIEDGADEYKNALSKKCDLTKLKQCNAPRYILISSKLFFCFADTHYTLTKYKHPTTLQIKQP